MQEYYPGTYRERMQNSSKGNQMSLLYRLAFGAALVGVILGLAFYQGRASLRPTLDKWKSAAGDYKLAANRWEGRYSAERSARDADHQNAVNAVSAVESACSARVAAARKSEAAIHRLMARPVRVDAAGCPAPVIWRSDVLQASMRPVQ